MTTTIGRCSFDNGPSFLSWDGDAVSIGINILPDTLEEAKVMRQQLLGLMNNPDESAFPVTCTTDSDLDGFYTVSAVQVEPVEAYIQNKLMRCSLGLVRVSNGYQNPTIETTVVSRLATNSHSITSSSFALGASWRNADDNLYDLAGMPPMGTAVSITAVDGTTVKVRPMGDTDLAGYWSLYATPSTHYSAPACMIEYKVGSTWYQAVGRQVPNGVPWRISNGFVRIGTIAAMPETNVTIEVADTSAYVGREITYTTIAFGGEAGPFIVRNSPETVSVKVQTYNGVYSTFTVWRGGVIAMISMTQSSNSSLNLGVNLASGVAGTNVTGGIRMTSNDANGNRLVLLSRSTVTTDTANTGLYVTAPTSAVFGVGYNLSAAGSGFFSESGMLQALCSPPQWRQRIAAR